MKKIYMALMAFCLALASSCTDDLDQKPHIGTTADDVFSTIGGYDSMMAKIYASFILKGDNKGGGDDISTFGGYELWRSYFNLQEGTTDTAAFRWVSGDNLWGLCYLSWDANDGQNSDTYYRIYYTISLCNEFIRRCDSAGGFSDSEMDRIAEYKAETRFVRAMCYEMVLDLYRQGAFVDENTPTAGVFPPAYDAARLLKFVEDEINGVINALPDHPQYARAGKGAAYALLARMYLNAETYTGTARLDDCIAACKKVMELGYSLENDWKKLFNADNDRRTNEIIFAFASDATESVTWGGGTYIVCGSVGSDNGQVGADYGISTGWGNFRSTGAFYDLFDEADGRRLFFTEGQDQYITKSIEDGSQGYHFCKFTNLTDAGEAASNSAADGCNTDIPVFRLAEIYLTAAEAVARGGQGMSRTEALGLVNQVRERAFGNDSGNISDDDMTVDFFIDERGRELYLEGIRRTDLVRFNRFTSGSYLWEWKGGVAAGRAVDARYNHFPIPAAEISANPNLKNSDY